MLRTEGFAKWLKLLDFDRSDHRGYIFIFSDTELTSIVDFHVLFGFKSAFIHAPICFSRLPFDNLHLVTSVPHLEATALPKGAGTVLREAVVGKEANRRTEGIEGIAARFARGLFFSPYPPSTSQFVGYRSSFLVSRKPKSEVIGVI